MYDDKSESNWLLLHYILSTCDLWLTLKLPWHCAQQPLLIAFTDILDQDESCTTLRPFALVVSFIGSLPCNALSIVSISIHFIFPAHLNLFSSPSVSLLNFPRNMQNLPLLFSRPLHPISLTKKSTSLDWRNGTVIMWVPPYIVRLIVIWYTW